MNTFVKNIIVIIFLVLPFSVQAETLEIEVVSGYATLESPDTKTVLILDSKDPLQDTLVDTGWNLVTYKEMDDRTDEYLRCMDITPSESLAAGWKLRDISCQISNPANALKHWYKHHFGKIQADRIGVNVNAVPEALESMRKEL